MVRQAYTGNVFLAADNPSIIQQVITAVPNKGASNPALSGTCGPNSTTAVLVANANPGDSLTFSWKLTPFVNLSFRVLIVTVMYFKWPHNTGPTELPC